MNILKFFDCFFLIYKLHIVNFEIFFEYSKLYKYLENIFSSIY